MGRIEAVALLDLVRDVVGRLREQAAETGSRIAVDIPEAIVGRWDRSRLEQIVTNLLSNAIKYGAGHPILVSARAAGGRLRVDVKDEGRESRARSVAHLSRIRTSHHRQPRRRPGARPLHRAADRGRARRNAVRRQQADTARCSRSSCRSRRRPTRGLLRRRRQRPELSLGGFDPVLLARALLETTDTTRTRAGRRRGGRGAGTNGRGRSTDPGRRA